MGVKLIPRHSDGERFEYPAGRVQTGAPIHARALAHEIKEEFGLAIHPRSIERALARKKKP